MSGPLPTPAEAMRQAIDAINHSDDTAARLWLDIAIELRRGSRPRAVQPDVESPSTLAREAEQATASLRLGGAIDDTSVVALPHCAHCERVIEWYAPGPDETAAGKAPYWRHAFTLQEGCPVVTPDQGYTYATPRVDDRG